MASAIVQIQFLVVCVAEHGGWDDDNGEHGEDFGNSGGPEDGWMAGTTKQVSVVSDSRVIQKRR